MIGETERRPIHLYLGEGVSAKDLIDTYCWLKIYNYQTIELVTSSGPFDEFYSVKDYINLDEAMFDRFYEETRLPPTPQKETEPDEITDIYVDTGRDLRTILDSTTYRLNISS
ncbi:MAG: hypothetical protein AAF740_07860 [Bacteroidota bacterium]